jgi:hypothetical protein
VEISSAQALPAGWDVPATAGPSRTVRGAAPATSPVSTSGAAPGAGGYAAAASAAATPAPLAAQQLAAPTGPQMRLLPTPKDRDSVVLAKAAFEDKTPPPPPAKPVEQPFDLHPLASAAGRYPLVNQLLEDAFGLDTSASKLKQALSQGIDLAA